MSAGMDEVAEIRHRMAQVRRDLNSEIHAIISDGELMPDWRWYVRKYPWAFLTAAAVAGYVIVPSRGNRPSPTVTTAPVADSLEEPVAEPTPGQPQGVGRHVFKTLWEIAYPVAIRAAQGYAAHRVEQWIHQQGRQAAPEPVRPPHDTESSSQVKRGPEARSSDR